MPSSLVRLERVVDALREAGLLVATQGASEVEVRGVSQDSRRVEPGDLFLAWAGVEHDAHTFVPAAVAAGAVAAVVEREVPGVEVPQLRVSDARLAGAIAADVVLGSAWRRLFTVGVTGTNGKTTTAHVARHLLAAGETTAVVGTLGLVQPDGLVRPGTEGLTTPGPVQLSTWLRDMEAEGVRNVILEASSHALAQRRMDALRFDVVVFTTFGQDHLDYHRDAEEYLEAKAHLLDLIKEGGTETVNADEPAWAGLPVRGGRRLFWGLSGGADVQASSLSVLPGGSHFLICWQGQSAPVTLPLLGTHNVSNAVAAASIALAAGMSLPQVAAALSSAPQVPGRMEIVVREPFRVMIDFAHTPDALERLLDAVRPLVAGRLIVVFGAGGDRDRSKRPVMGRVVESGADLAVVTSDNPRTEEPDAIIDEIVSGMKGTRHLRITDRRQAIGRALGMGQEQDLILLAGKGHERYQVLGREKVPFDERQIVLDLLAAREVV